MTSSPVSAPRAGDDELVVLLDPDGRPSGTARKGDVHAAPAPYHLAFSCYAFRADGRLLVTRRALTKRTWPGVWTNTCCGHPAPGEDSGQAVRRRLTDELRVRVESLTLALPDFSYRVRDGQVEEHELCPVYLARVGGDVTPNPDEVDDVDWWTWAEFRDRAEHDPRVSPWSRLQAEPLDVHVRAFLGVSA